MESLKRCALKLLSFAIDATVAFFGYQIVAGIVACFWFVPFFPAFFVIWLVYYIGCYIACGKTMGQAVVNCVVSDSGGKRSRVVRIVLRECLTSFPAIILLTLGRGYLPIGRSLILLLICSVVASFRKKIFKIAIIRQSNPTPPCKRVVVSYLVLIIIATSVRAVNTLATCDRVAAEAMPLCAVPRPSANSAGMYIDFLKDNRQDINDYVIGLFDKYDHVILCERHHRDMTQYDMIYDLVTDPRFADRVGHMFTEIGCAESRDGYKAFVDTEFANDSAVECGLASFLTENQSVHLLWPNTNWFEFLKRMYYFNHSRDRKVEILFADRNWIDRSELGFRDSIMADNIINTIESDSIAKSLIIMNYRHAYLTPGNCGHYVERNFPGRVANVLVNTAGISSAAFLFGKELPVPIQHGIWDVAFEQTGDDGFAFDFENSPFGEDRFDHFVLPWSQVNSRQYKDMFTGMIYYKGLNDQIISDGYPHILDQENEQKFRAREEARKDYSLDYWIDYLKDGIRRQSGIEVYCEAGLIENKIYAAVCILALFLSGIAALLCAARSRSAGN